MNTYKRFVAHGITLAFVLCAALAFGAETKSGEKIAKDDADFIKEAAGGGMMEVQLGKAAQEQGSKSQVKEFGRRMQKDHSKADDQLKKIAAKKDVKIPTELEGKQVYFRQVK